MLLTDLPDEIRLAIFEHTFRHVRLKYHDQSRKRERTHDPATSTPAFSIFQVSRSLYHDPILHKALRTASTIHFSHQREIDQLYHAFQTRPGQLRELHHFSIEWKPRSVCTRSRTGCSIDSLVKLLRDEFPGVQSLVVTEDRFRVTLVHATAPDLVSMSTYAAEHAVYPRYTDDCGNQVNADLIVYDHFHCCPLCVGHHVSAARVGVEIMFEFKLRLGHSFGRPGMADGFHPAAMSIRDYILRIDAGNKVFQVPQRSFEDIQQRLPRQDDRSEFFYSFEKVNDAPVRILATSDGTVIRRYEEDKVWRAG